MWARSQASGLMSAECERSTSSSEKGATRSRVRRRASASASDRAVATGTDTKSETLEGPLRGALPARLPPHLEHLAHRRGAVGDARVQRAQAELEATGRLLVELGDQGVEAPALLVDQDD